MTEKTLQERLREPCSWLGGNHSPLHREAADRLDALEAENARLRAAEPVAWRVRVKSDDPEEWSLMPAGAGADYLERDGYEVQPLFTSRGATHPQKD